MSQRKSQEQNPGPGCPVCGGHRVGQVSSHQFYCWNCLVEFNSRREVFAVTEEGTLVAYGMTGGEENVI